jgi:hypothetical protein
MSLADKTRALWQRSSFVWGETDCILAMCNHVRDCTGIDPAAPWRGTYSTAEGAEAIYAPYGGPLALVRHGMAKAGFQVAEPQDGFPVVASFMGHEIAGVMMGSRVGFMAEGRGLLEIRAKVLEAWAI